MNTVWLLVLALAARLAAAGSGAAGPAVSSSPARSEVPAADAPATAAQASVRLEGDSTLHKFDSRATKVDVAIELATGAARGAAPLALARITGRGPGRRDRL